MADFEETMQSILSNPKAMDQIMALAGSLAGEASPTEPPDPPQEAPPPQEPPTNEQAGPSPEQLGAILKLVSGGDQASPEARALLTALRPFLRKDRQEKLDKVMRLTRLSHTAKTLYSLWKEGALHL